MPETKPKLFVSYARADDEPFVKRLYERLAADGFPVWWDRVSMPSRALTFLKEIREAVRECNRVVVVIGPNCVTSDYCRAEWQAGLAESKVVNPLMRQGQRSLMPPELRSLHCPDFRDDANFESAYVEMLRVLSERVPPLGALLGGVPDMPPHFQPRPDALSCLSEQLLIDEKKPLTLTGPQRVTVMHGMGGTGKSVLAAAFARSTGTRRSFGDGIYWLSADEQTAPLTLSARLGGLLGDPPAAHTHPSGSTSQLTLSLAELSTLIVVDNAWHVEQVEPLIDALGPACRLLVTTRDAGLVSATGGNGVELGQLSADAALSHLADWAGVAPEALPAAAAEVATECGYLPFALALNGAMQKKGVAWADLAAALRSAEIDFAEQRFKGYPYPTVLKSLKVSMDALDAENPEDGARLRELAAFRGNGGIPETAVAFFWQHTAGLAARHTSKVLSALASKAFVRLQGEGAERRVVVHDLQRDYLVRVTDADALDAALLAAYEHDCGGHWPGLKADGYVHEHLISHLLDGGRADEVHALLDLSADSGANAWFEASAASNNISAYLADLERVRSHCADEQRTMRLQLMRVSVQDMLAQIPAELQVAAVDEGAAVDETALDGARCITDPDRRVAAILTLVPQLEEAARDDAIAECLATVRKRADQVQARFLPVIAGLVDGSERDALTAEALEAARSIDSAAYRATALGTVLPLLSGALHAKVQNEAAVALQNSVQSASFREAAATALPEVPACAKDLLASIDGIDDPFLKAMAYEVVVPHLPPDSRADAASEGIAQFEASGANGLWIVVSLARHIPGFDLAGLIRRAATQDVRQMPALVDALPEMLSGEALTQALESIAKAAESFEEPHRIQTLTRLLGQCDADQRSAQVDRLLDAIPSLPYASWRRDACIGLIDFMPRHRMAELTARLARIEDTGAVLQSAAELSRDADEAVRATLFAKLGPLEPTREKFTALVALAEVRDDVQHPAVVEAAWELSAYLPEWSGASAAGLRLARLVSGDKRLDVLACASNAALRVRGFMAEKEFNVLSSELPGEYRLQGYRALLEDAEELSHHRQKYWAEGPKVSDNASALADTLAGIAPYLPAQLIPDALERVGRMTVARWRWAAYCHLLPYADGSDAEAVLGEVLAGAGKDDFFVDDDDLQRFTISACRALGHAVPVVQEGVDKEKLHTRLKSQLRAVDASWIPGLMKDVVPALTRQEVSLLVTRALATPNVFTAHSVSRQLAEPARWKLLRAALKKIEPEKCRDRVYADVLTDTVAALLDAPEETRQQAWQMACGALHGKRAGVAAYIALLAPLARSIGKRQSLGAAAAGLMDVQAWWP